MVEVVAYISPVGHEDVPKKAAYSPLTGIFAQQIQFFVASTQQARENTKELYTDLRREASQLGLSVSQYLLLLEILRAIQTP